MPDYVVVLVEPKIAGNIGSVARGMSNFGLEELVLYRPCDLGDDAYRFSKHGRFIVENARIVDELDAAFDGLDLIIGTSGKITENQKKFLRQPISPKELAEKMAGRPGKVGLVFGREDVGLLNDELARCDIMVNIPTHEMNPIMNLSHAATLVFYELHAHGKKRKRKTLAGSVEKEALNEIFSEMLDEIKYTEHKKAKTKVMFRKIVGRADLSNWEFHTLAGVFTRATKVVKRERAKSGTKGKE